MSFHNPSELITVEELCQLLAIGPNTAYSLLNAKKIKAFRIGKIWKIPFISVQEFIYNQSGLRNSD